MLKEDRNYEKFEEVIGRYVLGFGYPSYTNEEKYRGRNIHTRH